MCDTLTRVVSYPARKLTALRPTSYRSAADPGVWSIALRRLNANGYSDSDIAYFLNRLSPRAILDLEAARTWSHDAIEDVSMASGAYPWTKHTVGYHRRKMGLPPGVPPTPQQGDTSFTAGKRQSVRRRLFQTAQGWFGLLPAYIDGKGFQPGHELRPTEVRILTILWRHGALTKRSIASCLGKTDLLDHDGRSYLERLRNASLIRSSGWRPPLWSLRPGLRPDIREATIDGHLEKAAEALGIESADGVCH